MTQVNGTNVQRMRMPVLFVGHGSPMNALEENRWSRGFTGLSHYTPRPAAILAVSAHWYVDGTFVTAGETPETIHDFGGFPDALYKIQYPAPGSLEIAERVAAIIATRRAALTQDWGLDHGTWSVLRWMYPDADVPVIQLSIDRRLTEEQHLTLAQSLRTLRDQGVLIIASGNIVHNLHDAFAQKRAGTGHTPDWAKRFDDAVFSATEGYQTDTILGLSTTDDGHKSHPTPEHWLPLIYAYGAAEPGESVSFPIEGFDWGSISMRAIVFGGL